MPMPMTSRSAFAVVLLVIGAGLARLAVPVYYEFMKMYGDTTGTA